MVELRPCPIDRLARRMFAELDEREAIFDLPAAKFFTGDAEHDLSVRFHGRLASSPLGPAAGPHSQMAQNLVLAWLGGSRIFELKTVQVLDELQIPRPCIDMQNVGYNVEWSQELKLEQSLEEYVKASMLIEMLRASGRIELAPGFEHAVFDMSVGYDLAGIRSPSVSAFLAGMRDASAEVERLRAQLPRELGALRDLDFTTRLSDTLTLSTFHGCPPDEIEAILDFLLREHGLHCVVKLNPTLLGPDEVRRLLHDELGYDFLRTPTAAFEKDTRRDQAVGFVERLAATAAGLGLGFGVKFSNTLIVENHRSFFPSSEEVMYLSGPPLHVLAMHLVRDFRRQFGGALPISFSAGVDARNFADAVALGLTPITVCTDLLKPGGYARQAGYLRTLIERMDAVGARTIEEFALAAYGTGAASVEDAVVRNAEHYVDALLADPRYRADANEKVPRKIGSALELFDCITCDKCIPVCPNDANFALALEPIEIPVVHVHRDGDRWVAREEGSITLSRKHQIANVADFCNECGNCDVFCPEDGGPYLVKPRFFLDRAGFEAHADRDGFVVERDGAGVADAADARGTAAAGERDESPDATRILARIEGREIELHLGAGRARYRGPDFDVTFAPDDPVATLSGDAAAEVDLTWAAILRALADAVAADVNAVSA